MPLVEDIMQTVKGRFSLLISVRDKPAVEVSVQDKAIIIDVKNPLLALELGMEHLTKDKEEKTYSLRQALKERGFRIKVKYAGFAIDV